MSQPIRSGVIDVASQVEAIPNSELRRAAQKSLGDGANMHQMVHVFHRLYDMPIVRPEDAKADFSHISRERLAMRFGLIVEEFMELCMAMDIRPDINFLYQDENDNWVQSYSVIEQECFENLQANKVTETGVATIVWNDDGFCDGMRLKHENIDDDQLQVIVRERLRTAIEETEERDMVEVADACCDLKYVVIGFELEMGIPSDAVAREVQAANLSKLGADGKPIYRADGKVMKGPNYFRPRVELALRAWGMKLGKVFGR